MAENPASQSSDHAALSAQVERVLGASGLGRSDTLERLLRYLLACSLDGRAPKEVEIAQAVFSRSHNEASADSSVRVYVHRLRRKLDEFYAEEPAAGRLILPKGSYLLALSATDTPSPEQARPIKPPHKWRLPALCATVALLLGAWAGLHLRAADPMEGVRSAPPWQAMLSDDRPRAIVMGDYYIFGERDGEGNINRMRREFTVNSAHDLADLKAMGGDPAGHYTDLGLTYLPVGIGDAMRSVAPVLAGDVVTVLPASQVSGQMLQNSAILYIGYVSGLGTLRSPVFDGSRFTVGASYDELVDGRSSKHYLASSHLEASDTTGEDYALISSFRGPGGNRILTIAGTRDAALMAAAAFLTRPATLAQLDAQLPAGGGSFEALLGIPALHNVGLDARLILVAPRRDPSWTAPAALPFPDEISAGSNPGP